MQYEKPELKVLSFAQEDILTASGDLNLLITTVNHKEAKNLGAENAENLLN